MDADSRGFNRCLTRKELEFCRGAAQRSIASAVGRFWLANPVSFSRAPKGGGMCSGQRSAFWPSPLEGTWCEGTMCGW